MDDIIVSLAREYVDLIDAMRAGVVDPQTLRDMEAQRGVLHEQLLSFLGESRMSVEDMYQRAKQIIRESRRRGGL